MGRLKSVGSSQALKRKLFPVEFAGEVMVLILDIWKKFSLHRDVRLETRITALFRDALIDAYCEAGKRWFISLEDTINDPTFGTELGRNDLRIYLHELRFKQTIFFTIECKRLRVKTDSAFKHLADKYVTEGLQKFVDGKYSSGLPYGGMLGYVMDNRLDDAFEQVKGEIKSREANLKTIGKAFLKSPSSKLRDYRWSADTFHQRNDGKLCVHHLLVGVPTHK